VRYPQRGEVWLVDLGLTAKVRPCVVVSAAIQDDDRALIALIPHTTSVRGTQYETSIPVPFLKAGAFDVQGIVTVPPVRAVRLLGRLTATQMANIEEAVCRWLQLPCDPLSAR